MVKCLHENLILWIEQHIEWHMRIVLLFLKMEFVRPPLGCAESFDDGSHIPSVWHQYKCKTQTIWYENKISN